MATARGDAMIALAAARRRAYWRQASGTAARDKRCQKELFLFFLEHPSFLEHYIFVIFSQLCEPAIT